jgi:hypothetical protein
MPDIKKISFSDVSDTAVDLTQFSQNSSETSTTTEITDTSEASSETVKKSPAKPKNWFGRNWKKIGIASLVLLVLLSSVTGAIGYMTYQTAQKLKVQAAEMQFLGTEAYAAFKAQDLITTEAKLNEVQNKLGEVRATYDSLGFYRYVPIANAYYTDGIHGLNAAEAGVTASLKSLDAIVPYADVLGFSGEGTFTGGTAEDRLKVVLETLDKVTPVLDDIANDLKVVESELAMIDESRYPEEFRGQAIRPYVIQAKDLSHSAVDALTVYRPIIEQLPEIAGGTERKKYLVLFQNDNELRPTGGFLTAYAVIYIEDGKVTPDKSDDIYELDKKFTKNIPIPEALGRYLTTERYYNLRDMNISPDYKTSMDEFLTNYKTVRGEPQDIDGIIAVDTHFLTDLLTVLGPVEVPGYGTFSAEKDSRCDCPQVVYALSEIITRPTPYLREDRKGILGPMMRAILTKAYGAPKQQWPALFEQGLKDMAGRHVQMYFFDEEAQAAAEAINAGGRMTPPANGDFLAIVNANLGGAKSNLFINYDVAQEVSAPENGRITKTVEITYRNNRRADNCNLEAGLLCLNSTLRDWTRLYVPAGAQLESAQGFTQEPKVYEEAGFAVIDGFFTLEPNSQAKVKVTYTVPYEDATTYKTTLWKQGGVSPFKTLLDVNGSQEEVTVDKDITFETAF